MRRLALCLAVVVAALVVAPVALADGPLLVGQGGSGVATRSGAFHYVAVSDGARKTLLEKIDAKGQVNYWASFKGGWGIPTLGYGSTIGQGLSWDGRALVLEPLSGPFGTPSRFLLVDPQRMRLIRTITLAGSFTFDALSPDLSRLYLIQYTRAQRGDLNHYIVRAYDLRTGRLLPGRIADRTQRSWVMKGLPLTRTWSVGGRWVYTLYTNPGGYPFIHALDTKRGVAHCIQLPWEEDRNQAALYNLVLDVRDGGRTLDANWKTGKPWVHVAVGSWRVSEAGGSSPWAWIGAGVGACLALVAAGALFLRRRRREEVAQHAGHELGLA